VAFFDATTPTAKRVSLLENGSSFSPVLTGQASSTQGKETSAQVTAVTVAGSTASVTWNLLLSNIPVIKGQKGKAVLTKGVWKVSQSSFCGLLSMQPPVPAACKA
jgi:protein-S-isoprenylcysteine O-methyltransferase Ste14